MSPEDFEVGMARLETIFNEGVQLKDVLRGEYYEALRYVDPNVFLAATKAVIDTFRPFESEKFPSVATIENAVIEVRDDEVAAATAETRRNQPPEYAEYEYCQLCENSGLYLGSDGLAHPCRCERGRLKQAGWRIDAHARKREERVLKARERLPSSSGPVRGLKEKNSLGLWEPTVIEHRKWVEKKLLEIEALKKRAAERPQKPSISDERRFEAIRDVVTKVKARERFPAAAERQESKPEAPEEDDEIPF